MQLKRDTGYALKILVIMAEALNEGLDLVEMSIKEISIKSGISKLTSERLCEKMNESGLIKEDSETSSKIYTVDRTVLNVTLFDVIVAIEGNTDIFALLDKNSEPYKKYGGVLELTSKKISDDFKGLTIGSIFKK